MNAETIGVGSVPTLEESLVHVELATDSATVIRRTTKLNNFCKATTHIFRNLNLKTITIGII